MAQDPVAVVPFGQNPGELDGVHVDDNQNVRAGQLLVTIDDRDYRATLDQALAALAADRAQVDQASAQVSRQPSIIRQSQAQQGQVLEQVVGTIRVGRAVVLLGVKAVLRQVTIGV